MWPVLQAGCYYHALHHSDGNEMTAGYFGAVPAAVRPVQDDAWPRGGGPASAARERCRCLEIAARERTLAVERLPACDAAAE